MNAKAQVSGFFCRSGPRPGYRDPGLTRVSNRDLHSSIISPLSDPSTLNMIRHPNSSGLVGRFLDHLMQRPSTHFIFCFFILIVCMPFISRPIINVTRTASLNLRSRATATTTAAGFALFSSSSSSSKPNQQKMGVEKSESEWQAQLSPEQVIPTPHYASERAKLTPRFSLGF